MAAGLWRAVQTYRRTVPAQALAWYAMPDGEWSPLDEAGWESVRKELLETRWPTGSEARPQESHTDVGAHGFEYPGKWLDAYNLRLTAPSIGTRARGACWLTFLGQPLLGQLGGTQSLRQRLPPSIALHPLGDERLLLHVGEGPMSGDTTAQDDMAPYRALARVLEPHLYQERAAWLIDEVFERRWLRRFLE